MFVRMKGNHVQLKTGKGVLLLDHVKKAWGHGVKKGGSIGSNKMIGIISNAMAPVKTESLGGDLLNSLSFGRNVKKNNRDNIKFIF